MRRHDSVVKSILVFGFLSACIWWRPLFTDAALFGDLLYKLFFPNQEFLRRTVLAGSFPLWNPHIYSGVPFAANMQSAVFYPFSYMILPLDSPRALAWSLWAHTALAGIFMFALARSLGLSKRAALAAGIVFSLNGNFLLRFAAPSHFFSYVWLPLILLAGVKKELRLWQSCLIMSGALSLQLFAGHPQYLLYSAVACAVCLAVGPDRKRWLLVMAGGGAGFLALAAVQLLLTVQFLGQTVRAEGFGYEWSMSYSLAPRELLVMLALPQWNAWFIPRSGDPHIVGLYFGPVAACAAVWGLRARRSLWLPFAALTVLGFALALGKYLPVYPWLYAHASFFRMIRFPSQAIYLSCLGLSVLAGLGVDRLSESRARWVPVLIALDLLVFAWRGIETIEPRVYSAVPSTAAALSGPQARVMLTPRTRNDLGMTGANRTEAWLRFKDVMFPNFPMAYGIDAADGQEELRYSRYEKVLDRIDRNPQSAWIDVVGVTYVLTKWDLPPKFKLVSTGTPNVYLNAAALPRAYVVHEAAYAPDGEVLDDVERSGAAALLRRVIVSEPNIAGPSARCASRGTARIVEYSSQRVRVEASSPCPGWLVLADAYDPGWRARLNGSPAEVHRVNFVQRAVRLPPGRSAVEFDYRPRFLLAAAWVSALAWVLALGLLLFWAMPAAFRRAKP